MLYHAKNGVLTLRHSCMDYIRRMKHAFSFQHCCITIF